MLLAPLLAMAEAAPLGVDEAAAMAASEDVRAASPEALAVPDEAAAPARCWRAAHARRTRCHCHRPNVSMPSWQQYWQHVSLPLPRMSCQAPVSLLLVTARAARAEVCRDLEAAVRAFGLEGCWAWKPLLDGREVRRAPLSPVHRHSLPVTCLSCVNVAKRSQRRLLPEQPVRDRRKGAWCADTWHSYGSEGPGAWAALRMHAGACHSCLFASSSLAARMPACHDSTVSRPDQRASRAE